MMWIVLGSCGLLLGGVAMVWRAGGGQSTDMPAATELPIAFGYRMAWIAVRTRDTARLIEVLKLRNAHSASWSEGIGSIYAEPADLDELFVSPPIDGWSFVAGLGFPHLMSSAYTDNCTPALMALSQEFGEVQYYVSFPALEYFGWAKLNRGELLRAFAIGREGVVWNRGAVSDAERALNCGLFNMRDVATSMAPDGAADMAENAEESIAAGLGEQHVLALAERWSLDPTALEAREDLEPGIGYMALAPLEWHARLLRPSAA
jgi:hypothetical protein